MLQKPRKVTLAYTFNQEKLGCLYWRLPTVIFAGIVMSLQQNPQLDKNDI